MVGRAVDAPLTLGTIWGASFGCAQKTVREHG